MPCPPGTPTGAARPIRTLATTVDRSTRRRTPRASTSRWRGTRGPARPCRSSCWPTGSGWVCSRSRSAGAPSRRTARSCPSPSAPSSACPSDDADGLRDALAQSGIKAAVRAGSVRLSTHVYNTAEQIDAAARQPGKSSAARRAMTLAERLSAGPRAWRGLLRDRGRHHVRVRLRARSGHAGPGRPAALDRRRAGARPRSAGGGRADRRARRGHRHLPAARCPRTADWSSRWRA